MNNNIFLALYKFSVNAPENYLTEAFVFLLKEILMRNSSSGLSIIQNLSGLDLSNSFTDPSAIELTTQILLESGRPDIEIRLAEDILVYVEIKHDSPLHKDQLENYLSKLKKSGVPSTSLVLLTRSRQTMLETTLQPADYHHKCWYEIYDWLKEAQAQDVISSYLIDQFLTFLEDKRMNLQKVTWEYSEGIASLLHLVDMIEAAIQESRPGIKIKKSGGWNFRGYYIGDFWCGVRYDHPMIFVVERWTKNTPLFKRELDLETLHFLALTKNEQFEKLVGFIKNTFEEGQIKVDVVISFSIQDEPVS